MRWYFGRFHLDLMEDDVEACSHPGSCDDDVEAVLSYPYIRDQLDSISDEDLAAELREYGAWTPDQLQCRLDNEARIVWIAAGNIKEDHSE